MRRQENDEHVNQLSIALSEYLGIDIIDVDYNDNYNLYPITDGRVFRVSINSFAESQVYFCKSINLHTYIKEVK